MYKMMKTQIGWIISAYNLANLTKIINPFRQLFIWYNNRTIHKLLAPAVEEVAREVCADSPSKVNTITNLAMRAYYKRSSDKKQDAGKIDEAFLAQVIAHLKLFVFAGSDTTSTTLCFAYYYLSLNTKALAKIRAEHDAVLGPDPSRVTDVLRATPSLITQLPYTAAVVKEVLRLNPPAASIRAGGPDRVLVHSETKTQYPTDGFVLMSASHAMGNNPKYYTDPDVFNPDRWFDEEGNQVHPVKNAYRPFELGPRNCIGQELSRTEMTLILCMTIREFDITPAYPENSPTFNGHQCYMAYIPNEYLPRPKDGLPVKIKMRNHIPVSQ